MRKPSSILLGLAASAAMIAVAAADAPAAPAAAPDAAAEISTALAHAQMALAGKDVNEVHMHLHHVINCLVGPAGKQFDAKEENPCKGMGNGALNDVGGKSAQHKQLAEALDEAEEGLGKSDQKQAQNEAQETIEALQDAQKAK